MSTPDFRDEIPVWVEYLTWVNDKHDKYYEVRIDLGDDGLYYVTKRWGRRPDKGDGQTQVSSSLSMDNATSRANAKVAEKVAKGYRNAPRPGLANSHVPQDDDATEEE